jgi:hypothetical protein
MPQKQITQAELRAVLDVYNQSLEMAYKLQRRLQDGAEVEPGKFVVENEYGESLEEFTPTVTLAIGGIDIQPAPIPEWVTEVPKETQYVLTMWTGENVDLDITRSEFIALKAHLAKMRGHEALEVTNA